MITIKHYHNYQQESLQMYKRINGTNDHPGIAKSLISNASIYEELHDYDKSLSNEQELLQMLKRIHGTSNNLDVAESLSDIAHTYYELEDYDNAMFYQHQAEKMFKHVFSHQPLTIAKSLIFLSKLYKLKGDVENMTKYKQEAADIIEPIDPEEYANELAYYGLAGDDDKVTNVTCVNDKRNDDDSPVK